MKFLNTKLLLSIFILNKIQLRSNVIYKHETITFQTILYKKMLPTKATLNQKLLHSNEILKHDSVTYQ